MKTRRLQEFHDYIFGNRANIDLTTIPDEHKQKHKDNRIKAINEFFFSDKEPLIKPTDRKKFQQALKILNAKHLESVLFKSPTDDTESYSYPSAQAIETRFRQLESEHHFFEDNEYKFALEKFTRYFTIAKLIGDFVEQNNEESNQTAFQHAYKLLVLFGDQDNPQKYFQSFDRYLRTHNLVEEEKSVHDSLIWTIPQNTIKKIHLPEWREIIYTSGARAYRIFNRAPEIEEHLHAPPKDFAEALGVATTVGYKNYKQFPELAEIALFYNISEAIYNRCLSIKPKTSDELPHIHINGKNLGFPGYHFVKLPIDDPRAYFLGYITKCCQSIGGDSEECVIDGITRKKNGFYVLLKEKKKSGLLDKKLQNNLNNEKEPFNKGKINYADFEIVGQGYAWFSDWGNLVFDSWENLRNAKEEKKGESISYSLNDDAVIEPFLRRFAAHVTQDNSPILRVSIGLGGKTPTCFRAKKLPMPETIAEGVQYTDSNTQGLVYCSLPHQNDLIKKLRDALDDALTDRTKEIKSDPSLHALFSKEMIYSTSQADGILNLLKNRDMQFFLKTQDNQSLLLEQMELSHGALWNIFIMMDKAKLIHPTFLDKVISFNPHKIHDFYIILLKLSKNNLLNQETFDLALRSLDIYPHDSKFIATAMTDIFSESKTANYNSMIHSLLNHQLSDLAMALLKRAHFDVNQLGAWGAPIHFATKNSMVNVIELLQQKKADINLFTQAGCTALHSAIDQEQAVALQTLLELKADPNLASHDPDRIHKEEKRPLQMAAEIENGEIIKILLQHKANVHSNTRNLEETPLQLVINKGNTELTHILLEAKANPNVAQALTRETPLHTAVSKGYEQIIKLLIDHKADLNAKTFFGSLTPLHLAAKAGSLQTVNLFIEAKVNINSTSAGNETALHMAAKEGHVELVKNLLAQGADPSIKNKAGKLPLDHAKTDTIRAALQTTFKPSNNKP